MAKKIGRPKLPKGTAHTALITCRVSLEEKREISAAAKRAGKEQSEWVRESLLNSAR
jgi:hypothetical protein